jgi:hypothetical protein
MLSEYAFPDQLSSIRRLMLTAGLLCGGCGRLRATWLARWSGRVLRAWVSAGRIWQQNTHNDSARWFCDLRKKQDIEFLKNP